MSSGVGYSSFKKHDGRMGAPGEGKKLEFELRVLTDVALVEGNSEFTVAVVLVCGSWGSPIVARALSPHQCAG